MMKTKGQSASSAAVLVAIIAGMIVLYILFLPADIRKDLLGEQGSVTTTTSTGDDTSSSEPSVIVVFEEAPGRIDYLKVSEFEHALSSVNLYTTTEATVLQSFDSVYVKNGIFDREFRNVTFAIDDVDNTNNVLLSFTPKRAKGRLSIALNGETIFDKEVGGVQNPIALPTRLLKEENLLTFEVSEVGFRFWTTNEYQLTDLKITGDVTDVSEQLSSNTFIVTDSEKFNLEKATLKFFPDCNPRSVGALTIYLNNENVYSSIPDCGQLNLIELSPSTLSAGENALIFKAQEGRYLIYQIIVKTKLKQQTYPVYYFDLEENLFSFSEAYKEEQYASERMCGDVDGYCPTGCDEDIDADCCFKGKNNYWCDIEPEDEDDRCVAITNSTSSKCGVCTSGYEDKAGKPATECKGLCGDDTDDVCLSGCSKYYDKDCCFAEDKDNFWCDDVPIYGVENICEVSLSEQECDDCANGYYQDGGKESADCKETTTVEEIMTVKPGYTVLLNLYFADDSEKKAINLYINGHKSYVDTKSDKYSKDITAYVESGNNAIKIEPDSSALDIRKMVVEIRS